MTLIQHFGSMLNLNIHFHMLWLDGVSGPDRKGKPRLQRARAQSSAQLTALAGTIAHRVCCHLARRGWLEGEGESAFQSDCAGGDDAMDALRALTRTVPLRSSRCSHCYQRS